MTPAQHVFPLQNSSSMPSLVEALGTIVATEHIPGYQAVTNEGESCCQRLKNNGVAENRSTLPQFRWSWLNVATCWNQILPLTYVKISSDQLRSQVTICGLNASVYGRLALKAECQMWESESVKNGITRNPKKETTHKQFKEETNRSA